MGGGCHPNRDTRGLLERSSLELGEVTDARIPKAPAIVRPAVVGSARRA
ncbi:MAG: hypothetical protein HZB46_06790 [Solirubrobacterales bacterium]|nr:hypothetical protein [Solirubrobacterales bacterium]